VPLSGWAASTGWADMAGSAEEMEAGAGISAVPQFEQKRLVARLSQPQFGQVCEDMIFSSLFQAWIRN
jgi:hypothetical protein